MNRTRQLSTSVMLMVIGLFLAIPAIVLAKEPSLLGVWNINANNYVGTLDVSQQTGGRFSGTVNIDPGRTEQLTNGTISGNKVSFTRTWPGQDLRQDYTGTLVVGGDRREGTMGGTFSQNGAGSYSWSAQSKSACIDTGDSGARFAGIAGMVEVRPEEDEVGWDFATLNTILCVEDHVRTGREAEAILSFRDLSIFMMKPETEVIIGTPPGPESKLSIVWGNLWGNIKKMAKDGTMEITMNQAVTSIKGTTFVCETTDKISTLKVIEGRAEFRDKLGKTVMVNGGEKVSATRSGMGAKEKFDVALEKRQWEKLAKTTDPATEGQPTVPGLLVLEDDTGPYQWIDATEVQTRKVHAGRAAFRSDGNDHFTHRLGVVGNAAGQYRYLDFWLYLDKPGADIQIQAQVDGAWGKRWGFDGDARYNGFPWAMEGTTVNLPSGRWEHQRLDLIDQLHIQPGQAITGLAFSSDNADVYYDSVYLVPGDTTMSSAASSANVSGNWTVSFEYQGKSHAHDMNIRQRDNGVIDGKGGHPAGKTHVFAWVIKSGSVTGRSVDFVADYTLGAAGTTMRVSGKMNPDGSMTGTWTDNYGGQSRSGTWSARRF